MFRNIILVYKANLKNHLFEKIQEIKSYFPNSNFLAVEYSSLKKEMLSKVDLVLTFGGDGTFVKAANLIEDSYILGINAEPEQSEGALASVTRDEISKLNQIEKNNFRAKEMQRIDIKLDDNFLNERAINEVYIGTETQFHSSRYRITFKENAEEQRSSGILVSTGTGSKAWFCSAGGEPFGCEEKKLKFVVREPYFGKRVFVPKILNGEISGNEKLTMESTRDFGGIISINDSLYPFNKNSVVEISLSKKPLRVLTLD